MNVLKKYNNSSNNLKQVSELLKISYEENSKLLVENDKLKTKIKNLEEIIKNIRYCMFMASFLIIILSLALKFK